MSNNTIADTLITFVDNLIKEQAIADTSRIHVLLDYADLTYKSARYNTLLDQGRIEEAFKEPDIPYVWTREVFTALYRLGVSIDIYTSRVDTKRVEEKGNFIMTSLEVPGLFNSYFCIRQHEDDGGSRVIGVANAITSETMPADGENIAILFCGFQSRIEAFKDADLRSYCSSTHTLFLDI